MPLVEAKCTNCAGVLKVDDSKETAICPYCGSAYIVEKAIYNYNITNNINVTDSIVNVYVEQSFDTEGFISRAKQAMKFGQYKEAEELFRKVLDNEPRNASASMGLMLCIMIPACLVWEKEVFIRVPDSNDNQYTSYLKGTHAEYMEVCSIFRNELVRARSVNPENYYIIPDFLALRGSAYEEKYRKKPKHPYYLCAYTYYLLFSNSFPDNKYSKLTMDRLKYYNDYSEYLKPENHERWETILTWEEYVSFDELKDNNLIGDEKYLFRAINPEELDKVFKDYSVNWKYELQER